MKNTGSRGRPTCSNSALNMQRSLSPRGAPRTRCSISSSAPCLRARTRRADSRFAMRRLMRRRSCALARAAQPCPAPAWPLGRHSVRVQRTAASRAHCARHNLDPLNWATPDMAHLRREAGRVGVPVVRDWAANLALLWRRLPHHQRCEPRISKLNTYTHTGATVAHGTGQAPGTLASKVAHLQHGAKRCEQVRALGTLCTPPAVCPLALALACKAQQARTRVPMSPASLKPEPEPERQWSSAGADSLSHDDRLALRTTGAYDGSPDSPSQPRPSSLADERGAPSGPVGLAMPLCGDPLTSPSRLPSGLWAACAHRTASAPGAGKQQGGPSGVGGRRPVLKCRLARREY